MYKPAVENYFIVHRYVSKDRTDYNILTPVLEHDRKAFGDVLKEVTANSGYCSEKYLLYLKEKGIASYMKLQNPMQISRAEKRASAVRPVCSKQEDILGI